MLVLEEQKEKEKEKENEDEQDTVAAIPGLKMPQWGVSAAVQETSP